VRSVAGGAPVAEGAGLGQVRLHLEHAGAERAQGPSVEVADTRVLQCAVPGQHMIKCRGCTFQRAPCSLTRRNPANLEAISAFEMCLHFSRWLKQRASGLRHCFGRQHLDRKDRVVAAGDRRLQLLPRVLGHGAPQRQLRTTKPD